MKTRVLFSFLLIGITGSGYAKNIDFCKAIKFETGSFNYSAIEQASSKPECRDKPVPLQYKGIKDVFSITAKANTTGGVSYLTWDESSKTYGYDKDELKSTIKDIVRRSANNKHIEKLNPIVKINFFPKENGGVVVSDIVFEDKVSKPISLVRDMYFYSQDYYAAVYSSIPIKYSQKNNV